MCLYPRILSQESFIRSYKWFLLEKHKVAAIAKAHSVAVGSGQQDRQHGSREWQKDQTRGSRQWEQARQRGSSEWQKDQTRGSSAVLHPRIVAVVLFCTAGF